MRSSITMPVVAVLLALPQPGYGQHVASRATDTGSRLERPARLDIDGASLDYALQMLHRTSGVNLLYSPTQLPRRVVSCACSEYTVAEALTLLLEGTRLRFQEVEEEVVIVPSRTAMPPKRTVYVARTSLADSPLRAIRDALLLRVIVQDSVAGTVVDAKTGQPLPGAQVEAVGTGRGAVTDAEGRFRIVGLTGGPVTLRVQRIGYRTTDQRVSVGALAVRFALDETAIRLDELVVTGTAVATAVRAVPSPITILTAEAIEEQRVQRVDQLFRGNVPGALAWDNGPSGYASSTIVRGTSTLAGAKFLKTYVDGVEIASPFYLSGIDPASIERIEILRGPQASTIYGAEALNGVMQIFTKHGRPSMAPEVELTSMIGAQETKYASNDRVITHEHRASIAGGGEAFSYHMSGAYRYLGEWVPEYHNQNRTLAASMRANQGPFTVQLTGRYTEVEVGMAYLPTYAAYAHVFPSPLNEVARYPTTTVGAQLSYDVTPWWSHHAILGKDMISTDHHNSAPRLTTPDDTLYLINNNDLAKTSVGYRTTLQLPAGAPLSGSLTLGTDQVVYGYSQVIFQSATLDPITSGTTLLSGTRTKHHNAGYYAQALLGMSDAVFLTAGLRAENSDLIGSDYGLAWAPRVGLSYATTLNGVSLKARGAYGKAIRAPLAFQVAGSAISNTIPNPLIGPEAQRGFDAGVELYFGDAASLEVTYYNQAAVDLIDRVVVDATTAPITFQYQNIGRVRNQGLEVAGMIAPAPYLSLRATYSLTTSEVQALSPDYTGALEPGDEPLGIPKHIAGATLTYNSGPSSVSLNATYAGTRTQMDYIAYYGWILGGETYRGSERAYWEPYPAFVKFGLRASRDLSSRVTALLNVDNLTNSQRFEDLNLNPVPGRAILVGLRVH